MRQLGGRPVPVPVPGWKRLGNSQLDRLSWDLPGGFPAAFLGSKCSKETGSLGGAMGHLRGT